MCARYSSYNDATGAMPGSSQSRPCARLDGIYRAVVLHGSEGDSFSIEHTNVSLRKS